MTTQTNLTCLKTRKQWTKWTEQEESRIEREYPELGLNLILPSRSRDDVRLKAFRMGIKYHGQKTKQTPWEQIPFEHRWLKTWQRNIPPAPRSVFDLAI